MIKKEFTRAYGLNEIALVPSSTTIDVELVDISVEIAGLKLDIPVIASAMDSVVSPTTAGLISQYGGLGVLNLEGVQTRYENPDEILEKIAGISKEQYVELMQSIYQKNEVKEELILKRIEEIKSNGGKVAVSSTPHNAEKYGPLCAKAGADIFVVQSTVVSTHFKTTEDKTPLNLKAFCEKMPIPVLVGNASTKDVTMDLMRTGIQGIFIGIGPGAACTTRGVLGIGVPMATAIVDAAAARDSYYQVSGIYVPIIADGGIVNSGDICKALACGADAVMIGSPLAKSFEAPGKGFHWGMATPNSVLPRGARVEVGSIASLEEIMIGPSKSDDGSRNFKGAIQLALATLGVETIKELQEIEVVIAPSLLTEGKIYQKAQSLGMYK